MPEEAFLPALRDDLLAFIAEQSSAIEALRLPHRLRQPGGALRDPSPSLELPALVLIRDAEGRRAEVLPGQDPQPPGRPGDRSTGIFAMRRS
jgi:hypothetical protein